MPVKSLPSLTPARRFSNGSRPTGLWTWPTAEGRPVQVEVQVMTLGSDVAWVALPGEIFVELGLSVKAASPFRQTNVVELANGGFYYVPHRSAYAEGQYEVISTRYAEGSGEMLVTAAIGLLGELHKQAIGH